MCGGEDQTNRSTLSCKCAPHLRSGSFLCCLAHGGSAGPLQEGEDRGLCCPRVLCQRPVRMGRLQYPNRSLKIPFEEEFKRKLLEVLAEQRVDFGNPASNSWLNVAVDRTSDNATLPKRHQACLTANARKNSGDNSTPRPGLSGTSQDDRLTFQPSTKISLYCAVLVFPSSMITKFGME